MSIPSFIASAIAAVLPLTGSTGPVDAQDQLAEPEVTQTADAEQSTDQSDEPGAHAEKGRITGDKEDVINGDQDYSAPILQSGKLAVQRELALATDELGHEFMNIDFKDSHSAHLTFPDTYNPDTDQAAVDRVLEALKINGYDNLTAAY
ncbi:MULTISPECIES: hypothetical protein [unclassified Corynebacterium]|uniref:hypothetical protein n=1 Tax=Corynebacterium TaxID=1716 RepID=UPI00254B2DAC|nr:MULTISPECIES: hypothetical protein [unclassified Corynebacterium]MDK8452970.1 hypothetical protein [Corynebacterium sp. MSK084]MDK8467512.1 hypothetical protein [Corynebacterium sp. MSK130]MDK8476445.1 hypothetical protein [Corynebacterium sp. MSK310]MDK8491966.1 hypothetical protein [Corynebacterium sp. MSK175]MDK8514849.1 hypothetical protein [Corynebacterium sp. MSK123]